MKQYLDALQHVFVQGEDVDDRTGVGTRSVFGYQMRFDLREGFPAVTTKKLAWRSVVGELLWFLEGSQDERRLAEITFEKDRHDLTTKSTIWTANADAQGVALGYTNNLLQKNLGPVYGVQWRKWNCTKEYPADSHVNDFGHAYRSTGSLRRVEVDQIVQLIKNIKSDPNGRRHILTAWNPGEIDKMALPPCHTMSQFKVTNGKLSCQMYQRSADMFLGVPFNIASYSLLTHMLAQILELEVGDFIWTGGDCHIYQNHMEQVQEQLMRSPQAMPTLTMPKFTTLDELLATTVSDYKLNNYTPLESIKAPMAV